jgi:hypothetical protein
VSDLGVTKPGRTSGHGSGPTGASSGNGGGNTSGGGSTGQRQGGQPSGQDDLAESIQGLTGDFVSDLLRLVGAVKPGGSGGGAGGPGGESDRHGGGGIGGLVGLIRDSVSDTTGGIPGSVSSMVGKALSGHQHRRSNLGRGEPADSVSKLTYNRSSTGSPYRLGSWQGVLSNVGRALDARLAAIKGQTADDE